MKKLLGSRWISGVAWITVFVFATVQVFQFALKKETSYPLLSKRITTNSNNDIIVNLSSLRSGLKEYLGKIPGVHSFYLEYLPTGTSIRIEENTELAAASLFKIPLVMSLYRAEEQGKLSLDEKVTVMPGDLNDAFGELYKKGSGYQLTLQEAVDLAIIESDNTAINVIIDKLNQSTDPSDHAFNFLDVEVVGDDSDPNQPSSIKVSSLNYASFLKCLYLACYLSQEHSQTILDKLTKSRFNDLIVSGVDKDVKVAHKIGSFSAEIQSDCGIVYLPDRPYLICMMLEGQNENTQKVFHDVSKKVYDYFEQFDTKSSP